MELNIINLFNAMPGACAQGLIWGIMAIGVYITYKILDLADLTVDGTMCTGGAVCVVMILNGFPVWISLLFAFLAGVIAGLVTGLLHTAMGIPAILAGILTQLGLYSINLRIMGGKANQALNVDKYDLLVSLRYIKGVPISQNTILVAAVLALLLIGILYWFFGTELGCAIRATGSNSNMSRAQGINTDRMKIFGLMLSNGIVAFASGLYAQYQGFSEINAGRGAIVIGLAAVIIGTSVFGRIKQLKSTSAVLLGTILYKAVLLVAMLWLPSTFLKLTMAVLFVAALLTDRVGKKKGSVSHG